MAVTVKATARAFICWCFWRSLWPNAVQQPPILISCFESIFYTIFKRCCLQDTQRGNICLRRCEINNCNMMMIVKQSKPADESSFFPQAVRILNSSSALLHGNSFILWLIRPKKQVGIQPSDRHQESL